MAALLWKYHFLSPSVYSRPSCTQVVRGPASDFAPRHRALVLCHLGTPVSGYSSISIESALGQSHQNRASFRRNNSAACQASRIAEFPFESRGANCSEVASPSQRVRRRLPAVQACARASENPEEEEEEEEQSEETIGRRVWKEISMHALGALLVGTILFGVAPAQAIDALKTCTCLLRECRVELARCIADPSCAANVACLQTCNNRPDETECQIGCGDLFENKVVDQFNDCAVSKKGCVPQKKDQGLFPVPPPSALVKDFNTTDFTGKWYITSGLNRTFDTFDCQLHEFFALPKQLTGKLAWRIPTPDGGFFTRTAVQKFLQKDDQPGFLYNHGNEFLHYQDDWYILSSKIEKGPDDYVFVYYRGSNDAWDGYGGAFVYTKSNTLPESIVPELTRAAASAGLDFTKFKKTDNTCGPEPPLFARLEKKVEQGGEILEKGGEILEMEVEEKEMIFVAQVKAVVNTVGKFLAQIVKGEVDVFNLGAAELKRNEELFLKELGDEERKLLVDLNMGAQDIERLFGNAVPIRKFR